MKIVQGVIKRFSLFSVIAFAFLLTGCATTQVPSNEYLLMDSDTAALAKPVSPSVASNKAVKLGVQLLPIKVADYLAGNEMVLVSKKGEVFRSQQNLWAEPLASQLNRLTIQAFIKRLPNIEWYGQQPLVSSLDRLSIEVDTFYGDLSGKVQIAGRWRLLSPTGDLLASKEFVAQGALQNSGYPALVQTLGSVWFQKVIDPMADTINSTLIKN